MVALYYGGIFRVVLSCGVRIVSTVNYGGTFATVPNPESGSYDKIETYNAENRWGYAHTMLVTLGKSLRLLFLAS
jgi:hypothetical protein